MKKKNPLKIKKSKPYKITEYREFIKFIALPGILRQRNYGFKNLGDFAKKYCLVGETLSEWQKREDFWKEVEKEWKRWGREKTPDVIEKFFKIIMEKGTAADFRLWFQYFLGWIEENKTKYEFPETLIDLIKNAVREIK